VKLPDPQVTAAKLRKLSPLRPSLAILLGSGFQRVAERVEVECEISYGRLAGFRRPGVNGHAGKVLIGHLGGTAVVVLSGRLHYYEGYTMEEVTFPMRTLAAYGVRSVVLTNAAGGINRRFRTGDFMALSDHINFMGANPLRGPAARDKARFVDLTRTYDPELGRLLRLAAGAVGVRLRQGVYLAVAGPSYETPAEIRALARLGADAVGMSTVPEAIVARQCGTRVAAVSCVTNLAAGRSTGTLDHADVLAQAEKVGEKGAQLLEAFARLSRAAG